MKSKQNIIQKPNLVFGNFVAIILVFFLFLKLSETNAQTRIYYLDTNGKETLAGDATYFLKITKTNTPSKIAIRELKFRMDSTLVYEFNFYFKDTIDNKRVKVKDGKIITYFKSGSVRTYEDYKDNKLHGFLKTYWENGLVKRIENHVNGNFIEGECFDSLGNRIKHFPYIVYPEFPNGKDSLMRYLKNAGKYPKLSIKRKRQGEVFVSFTVNKEGKVENVEVKEKTIPELDEEACRIVRMMPDWIPGRVDGRPVNMNYKLLVNFRLK